MDDQTAVRPAADPASAPPIRAELLHDGRVGPDDEELILAALTGCGVAAEVKIIPARRDVLTLTWLLLISLPLQGFLSTVGNKIAEDAYDKFTQAARRFLDRHRKLEDAPAAAIPPVLVLQDPVTGLRIIFDPDLPNEAYDQLRALNLSGYRFGSLHYDRSLRCWQPEQDEADTSDGPS